MGLWRGVRVKFLILVLSGGMLLQAPGNCAIIATEMFLRSVNWTWFLTCDTATLFTGSGILIDCGTSTTTTTGTTTTGTTTTSGLAGLLGL
jgi:hypothetical protein